MAAHRTRGAGAAAPTAVAVAVTCAVLLSAALSGCTDDTNPSSVTSRAASAAQSVGSQAASAFASATAEAGRKLDSIKGGVEAKDDVKLGAPTAAGDRTTVQVTATNTADSAKSFSVQVDFKDPDGTWRDTVLVTVADVPAGGKKTATARSTHQLPGNVRAEVPRAVRY
ncbi:hypothetical protein [Streptomyces sp. NPDC088812]|uniref:hypothetical protein n=1 Tax=Streptomyces sp. NPDC088812 TaxID=3365905 RepID=UPI00382A9DC8